ncbi:MAG: hypothetical protein COB71_06320 [Thiotrichales bacterium]|nr:MAG: hypothetical protein COB71_06320 [Thiotrichales bacterium]
MRALKIDKGWILQEIKSEVHAPNRAAERTITAILIGIRRGFGLFIAFLLVECQFPTKLIYQLISF